MESTILNGSHIRGVTAQGVIYVDDSEEEVFIDFAKCYENYVNISLNSEMWERHKQLNNQTDADWDRYVERVKRWREVGRRNGLTPPWADGPFIEFHTEPPVRFKFASHDEIFTEVLSAIVDA